MCQHHPECPHWPAPDHLAARIVADHPEQGWRLLCNGVIVFDDGGELLPDDSVRSVRSPVLTARANRQAKAA